MNKEVIKTVIKALPVIAIFILLLSSTYSRYSFASTGNTELDIASWNVTIKSDNQELSLEETKNIELKVENNPYVVNNKIAPGVTAIGTIEVDLTGTEVAVDIGVDIDKENLPLNFSVVTKLDGEILNDTTKVINLEDKQAFTTENGKKIITIELTWNNSESDEIDTALGIVSGTINLPVKVIVEQHI